MQPEPNTDISVESLTVRYPGGVTALDNVNLSFSRGLFGLLGPNGAGKTTLMRTLATLQKPSGGSARVFGSDVQQNPAGVRHLLGYLPQDFQTYPQLKVWEVLDFYGILNLMQDATRRRRRVDEMLERVGLQSVRNRKAGQLSGGMLRRLGVAQALLNDPLLLILDEPTVGLDPAERINFRNFLGELSRDRCVILSTHIVTDIGSSCERLAVIDAGQVRFQGARQTLLERAEGKVWSIIVPDAEYDSYRRDYSITAMSDTPHGVQLRFLSNKRQKDQWQSVEPTLEDAYLWLLRQKGNVSN